MNETKQLTRSQAIVIVEKIYQKYGDALEPAVDLGMDEAYETFNEISLIHNVSEEIVENTRLLVGDEAESTFLEAFTENTDDLREGRESEEDFNNRLFMINAHFAEELSLQEKNQISVDLCNIETHIRSKVEKFEKIGVIFNILKQDFILDGINELWGYNVREICENYMTDPFKEPQDLTRDLTRLYKLHNGIED